MFERQSRGLRASKSSASLLSPGPRFGRLGVAALMMALLVCVSWGRAQEPSSPAGGESASATVADGVSAESGATPDVATGTHTIDAHASDDGHAGAAEAGHGDGGHQDPVAPILAAIALILVLAKLSGDLVERVGMPAVLGELLVGVLLGNMALFTGWDGLDYLHAPAAGAGGDPFAVGAVLKMLAGIGVVLLLFEVGLESTVRDMLSVGATSLLVAVLGVVAPMILGYAVGLMIIPDAGWQVHAFIAATLSATSVGITARVLKDLGRSQQREAKIILGAAVIDDVLGLIVLAVVSGVIQQGANFEIASLMGIIIKAVGFLFGALLIGGRIAAPLFKAASLLRGHGLLIATALVICFGFSYLANLLGLAPIVGAFAAGLILEHAQYHDLGSKEDVELEEALRPLTGLLVPIFFVQMGIMVDLKSFSDPSVWGLAAGITVAAVIGKQVCSLGVLEKGLNRLAIGLGMIPRGEVGLIFAATGAALLTPEKEPVVDAPTYSAVVVMVMLTTLVTPPLLKWALSRDGSSGVPPAESPAGTAAGH